MIESEKFINILEDFDNSEPLLAEFSSANLATVSKSLNSQNKHEIEVAKLVIPSKVKALVKIINKVSNSVNAKLKSKYPNLKSFNVVDNVTYNSSGVTGKIEIVEAGGVNHLSFNIKKLSRLPALEVAALVTKTIIESVAKNNNKSNDETFKKELLDDSVSENKDETNNQEKVEKNVKKAKEILTAYLRNYLPSVFAEDFKGFKYISQFVAGQIIDEMSENDLESLLSPFFDLDVLEIETIANQKVEKFLGKTHKARLANIIGKAEYFAQDPSKEILSLGYEQQAQALIGSDTSDPSYKNLKQKFQVIRGEKCLISAAVKEFCEYYVQNFMRAHNAKMIEVTFESKGGLGTFYDKGESQSININLEKLKSMGSFTELAMTLSHELTHAIDSSRNKSKGLVNDDGTGLLNNISENISRSGATGEAKTLLSELKNYCYHINPNERRARIGELSALGFMQKLALDDSTIQKDLKGSIDRYLLYQKQTKDMINSLPTKLEEFDKKLNDMIADGAIKKNGHIHNMISERIKYLRDNGLGQSVEEETRSQDIARKILEESQLQSKIAREQAEQEVGKQL